MAPEFEKAIKKILSAYPDKDREWAERQLDRAISNTDDPVNPELIRRILKHEFHIVDQDDETA